MDAERYLQCQARIRAAKIQTGDLGDALQAIVQGIPVNIELARRLAGVGVLLKIGPQRGHQIRIVLTVIGQKTTEHLAIELLHLCLVTQSQDQPIEAQICVKEW